MLTVIFEQLDMEDGDDIDAFVEQVHPNTVHPFALLGLIIRRSAAPNDPNGIDIGRDPSIQIPGLLSVGICNAMSSLTHTLSMAIY